MKQVSRLIVLILSLSVALLPLQSVAGNRDYSPKLSAMLDTLLLLNLPDSADYFRLVDRVYEQAENEGNVRAATIAHYARITYMAEKYGASKAAPYLPAMRDYVAKTGKEENLLYDTWLNVICDYQERGNILNALDEMKKMLFYANQHDNDYGRAMAYVMFGSLNENSYNTAMKNLNTALEYMRKTDYYDDESYFIYYHMANIAYNNKRYEEAINICNQMEKMDPDHKQQQLYDCMRLLAYLELEDEPHAKECYERLNKNWENSEVYGPYERYVIRGLSKYLCEHSEPEKAFAMMRYIPEEYEDDRIMLLSNYYKSKGDYKTALKLQEQLMDIKDQNFAHQQEVEIYSANAILDNQTLEAEKQQLEVDNVSKTNRMNVVTIIALIIVILASLCVIYLFRRSQRHLKIERDRTEAERRKAVRFNDMKNVFIHNMSHEMRTPLNSILGFNDLLNNSGMEFEEEERKDMLKHIQFHSDQLMRLLDHVIILCRIDGNDTPPVITHLDVCEIIDNICGELRPKLHRGVALIVDESINDSLTVTGDHEFVKLALTEVIDNAIKFTEKGIINIKAKRVDGRIRIIVSDTGCGVPADKYEDIFNRFEKLGSFEAGFGLGLSCSRELLAIIDGTIVYDPTYTRGARFIIELPE